MAWTDRFVRADAAGGGDGTTDTASGANGAWTLAEAVTNESAGMRLNVKAGTYANTTTTRTLAAIGTTTAPIWWRGFKTTPGDMDADPTTTRVAGTDIPSFTWGNAGLTVSGAHHILSNLDISGARTGGTQLAITGANARVDRCRVENTAANTLGFAVTSSVTATFTRCWFRATTTATRAVQPTGAGVFLGGCTIEGGISGFEITSGGVTLTAIDCVFAGNLTYGMLLASTGAMYINKCSFYAPGSDGIRWSALPTTLGHVVVDCIFSQCGGYGLNNASGTNTAFVHRSNNLFYLNTSGNENGFGDTPSLSELTDSASPFVNAPTDMTIASGSLGIAAAMPGLFENESFRSYRDRGAVQRQGSGGSSVAIPSPPISANSWDFIG